MKSFIRYPGGKARFRTLILDVLKRHYNSAQYREPFFGGGSIGFAVLAAQEMDDFWVNDKDIGMYCLWQAVHRMPEPLKAMVTAFKPEVRHFDEFRDYLLGLPNDDLTDERVVAIAFRKLALHQISFSGLGLKSGGPLGGRNQDHTTKYPIDCRWSPAHICKQIDLHHVMMQGVRFRVTNMDFAELVADDEQEALIYLDPPYYEKGGELYHHAFGEVDHIRLSNALQGCQHKWVLSYDDCPEIRDLYEWAHIETFSANYTIHIPNEEIDPDLIDKQPQKKGKKRQHQKTELLIMPHSMAAKSPISDLIEFA